MERKPLPREAYLMRLLHCKTLSQLEKLMNQAPPPSSPEPEEPQEGFREQVERLAQEEDVQRELQDYQMSPQPN